MSSRTVAAALERFEVTASSPCRIDPSGGTWDLKALALPYESVSPSTVTISLDLRVTIRLHPYRQGWVRVTEGGQHEEFPFARMDFSATFGFIYPLVAFFGFDGLEIEIASTFPKLSGLGGSGALAVTTLSALNEVLSHEAPQPLKRHEIVEVAHGIEDGMHFSHTGLQDQAAAAYGGVNRWLWSYRHPVKFERKELLAPADYPELEARLVVAYLGTGHQSATANAAQVRSFFKGETRGNWLRIREITDGFARAISRLDWEAAIALVREEHDLRCSMARRRNTALGRDLEAIARVLGCGFAVAGAGGGGCVFALSQTKESAAKLSRRWQELLGGIPGARLLPSVIATQGTIVSRREL